MLPCAPLLWLMPVVLLQWGGRRPDGGPVFGSQQDSIASLLIASTKAVYEQNMYWAQVEDTMFKAAGGLEGQQEEREAMVDAIFMALGGAGCARHIGYHPQQQTEPDPTAAASADSQQADVQGSQQGSSRVQQAVVTSCRAPCAAAAAD
jgi:hypothetical protein